jgi:O-antigen/teichoic acid export membrane protein
MFKDIKRLGKETVIYGFSTVIVRLLNFILMPFYTHYLLPQEYGIVATLFSFIAFLNIIYGYGLNQGYMRHYKNENALPSSFNIIFYTSIPLSLILCIFSKQISYSLLGINEYRFIIYCAIILYLDSITLIPFADLRITHRAKRFVFVRTISIISNVILNILFLASFKMGIDGIFYANICSSFISLLLLGEYFKNLFYKIEIKVLKEIFNYSLPLLPAGLSMVIMQVIDRPIMMKLASAYDVGIYQANYRLAIIMNLIVTMFDQAWRPFVIERAEDSNAPEIFSKVLNYFSFIALFIWLLLSIFIGDIVSIEIRKGIPIVNSIYYQGLKIVPIIMGAYFLNGLYINFIAPLIIKKNTKAIMYSTILGAASNLLFNFILIPKYSIVGASLSCFASYLIMAVLIRYYSYKSYPVRYEYRKVAFLISVAIFLYLIYHLSNGRFTHIFLIKIALIFSYPVIIYFTGFFSREELDRIKSLIRLKSI